MFFRGSVIRTVLVALCGAYGFAAARAATSVAAKPARVPHGPAAVVRRRRSLTNGDSRDFDRSSSLLSMPVRLALLGNGHGPCGAAVWSAPLHAALPCGGGRRFIARQARASGGQGYFQHYPGTEPNFISSKLKEPLDPALECTNELPRPSPQVPAPAGSKAVILNGLSSIKENRSGRKKPSARNKTPNIPN